MEYTHNDEVAEIVYQYDRQIDTLNLQIASLESRLAYVRAELDRLEKDYSCGL
jgi:phage host-nuclease inhibitor protein Gam